MSNAIELNPQARQRCVLVVEDDAVNRTFLRLTLEKSGYQVLTASDVRAAQREFDARGASRFDCVISDYWLPDQTGLALLSWIKTKDPSLATIVLTAESDRNLLTESLRLGASDFLEKPVQVPNLLEALAKASRQTAHQRHMTQSDSAVKNLGRTQRWLMRTVETEHLELCFHPKFEAGGDFLARFQLSPEVQCCLLTDVSGHDPQAAYISAYFHGIFRGMLQRAAPLTGIFSSFNEFLVNEWNHADKLRKEDAGGTSVAAMALLIDSRQQTASLLNSGAPIPIKVSADARARWLGETGGPPLGWFPEIDMGTTIHELTGGGTVYLWTDGLADLADQKEVHPLSLAFALQEASRNGGEPALLKQAHDDVLFAAVHLPHPSTEIGLLQPIMLEEYPGDADYEIDQLEANWRRNLKIALPDLSDAAEYDIALATREAVLNGLKHGCQGDAGKKVRFQASYHRMEQYIRIWVEDPGPGHQFDLETHQNNMDNDLVTEHRGLFCIKHLANNVKFERKGATIIMDFQL